MQACVILLNPTSPCPQYVGFAIGIISYCVPVLLVASAWAVDLDISMSTIRWKKNGAVLLMVRRSSMVARAPAASRYTRHDITQYIVD